MTGTNRSTLSFRTFLFVFILLGAPMAARCDTLEDSAKELARKINAVLVNRGEMSCEIRNLSSLNPDEVARIDQALKAELHGRCVRPETNGSDTPDVGVTLSENVKTLMWTAEIHQGAEQNEILQIVPRSTSSSGPTIAFPFLLTSERFWEGPERILDAGFVNGPDGDRLLLLLLADGVLVRNANKNSESKIDISLLTTDALRNPSGVLSQQAGTLIAAQHDKRKCTISIVTNAVIDCEDERGGSPEEPHPFEGAYRVSPAMNCAKDAVIPWFVTGTGDDSQVDFLQVAVVQNSGPRVASNRLNFPGPILAIHRALSDASNTVITKNLTTGNYEAYRLSVTCSQ